MGFDSASKTSFVKGACAGLLLGGWLALSLVACDDDGVTADCPPMPRIDPTTGETEASRWDDPASSPGAPGGALNRWETEAVKVGCATAPQPISSPTGGSN